MNKNLAKANNKFEYNIPTAKAVGYSDYGEGLAKANNINDQYSFFPPDKSEGYLNYGESLAKANNMNDHYSFFPPDKSGGYSNPHLAKGAIQNTNQIIIIKIAHHAIH